MILYFKVAGYNFAIVCESDEWSDGLFSNYEPFQTDKTDNVIFTLTFQDNLDIEGRVPFCIDLNQEEEMSRIDVYTLGDNFLFEITPHKNCPTSARIFMSRDFSDIKLQVLSKNINIFKYSVNTSLMLAYAFSTASKLTLEMHSSVIVKDNKGYMFLGKSGTGKSTHSSLWLKNIGGCSLLNDDNPILRIINDKAYVFGSPWSGKTPCYKQEFAEVGAIVELQQYKENIISRKNQFEAYASLYNSCSGLKKNELMADLLHTTIEKVVLSLPFYTLKCLPDNAAAFLSYNTIK